MDSQELKEHFLKEKEKLEKYIDSHYKRMEEIDKLIFEIDWAEKETKVSA
jgi:hypothetical protein